MPESSPSPATSTSAPVAPRDASHNRGLHEVDATVVTLVRPSAHVLRVGVRLGTSADHPDWALPNVSFRIQLEEEGRTVSRVYTARSFWGDRALMEFDVLLHGVDSPMMRWATQARVGEVVRLIAPRGNMGIPVSQGRPVALFLDDSAIPALYAILQQWPAGMVGVGWIATDDTHALSELPRVQGLELHQVSPAMRGTGPLLHCARQLPNPAGYVIWGAGERDEMRAIREHFYTVVGLPKADVAIAGYWRRGTSNTEIDAHRQDAYRKFIAAGGTLADWDDLGVAV